MTSQKDQLRTLIREQRRKIPKPYRAAASAKICETFAGLAAFKTASQVAGFLAFDGEADPLGLMIQACEQNKKVFVPVVLGKNLPLKFAPWTPSDRLKPNRFGIVEPEHAQDEWVEPQELDFVITPLVAFDRDCNRIGVGGGFYDRSFEFLKSVQPGASRSTKLYGFAFELQKTNNIGRQDWDVTLDGVVTETQVYLASWGV